MYQIIQSREDRRDFAIAKENGISLTSYKDAKAIICANDRTSSNTLSEYAVLLKARKLDKERKGQ